MKLLEQNNFKCLSWKTVDLEFDGLEMMERICIVCSCATIFLAVQVATTIHKIWTPRTEQCHL